MDLVLWCKRKRGVKSDPKVFLLEQLRIVIFAEMERLQEEQSANTENLLCARGYTCDQANLVLEFGKRNRQ